MPSQDDPHFDDLERIREQAIRTALDSKSLDDAEKAATISNLLAERNKQLSDVENQASLLRFERLKSWAAYVVPYLTILTLSGTVMMQIFQLNATREANGDLQWRETAKIVVDQASFSKDLGFAGAGADQKGGGGTRVDPLLATALLRSYAGDEKYGGNALSLGLLVLSRAGSPDHFRDFFYSMKVPMNLRSLDALIATDRLLWTLEVAPSPDPKTLAAQGMQKRQIDQIVEAAKLGVKDLGEESAFLSASIADLLKKKPAVKGHIDFANAKLKGVDLSGATLSDFDFSAAMIDSVKLTNATMRGVTGIADWPDTNWWDASELDPKLLVESLIKDWYPYSPGFFKRYSDYADDDRPPEPEEYRRRVQKLCETSHATCPPELPYGKPQPAETKKTK